MLQKKILNLVLPVVVFLITFLIFSLHTNPSQSQDVNFNPRTMGGAKLMSPDEYLKVQQVKMLRSFTTLSGKPLEKIPATIDLTPEFPPVGKQEDPTCMAWTFAYNIKSFLERREQGWEYGPNHVFSPTFLYNLLDPRGDELGTQDNNPIHALLEKGAIPLSLVPYTPGDETIPSKEIQTFAKAFRIFGFRKLPLGDLYALKAMLASGEPVAIAIPIYKEFMNLNKKNPVMRQHKGSILDSHYLTVVGYDDNRHAFKVLNSCGKDCADNGTGWIDYDLYADMVSEAVVIYDQPTPQNAIEYLKDPKIKPSEPFPQLNFKEVELVTGNKSLYDKETILKLTENVLPQVMDTTETSIDWQKAPRGDPILIIPEEAGITTNKTWLRLGDPLEKTKEFFSSKVSPRLANFKTTGDDALISRGILSGDEVGRIDFFADKRLPVMTNRGVGLGSTRDKVHRIYKQPDDKSPNGTRETYFYNAVSKDWGGLKVINDQALEFNYDSSNRVMAISIFSAYKTAYTGQSLKPISDREYKNEGSGNVINSSEGHIKFKVPDGFSKVDKSVWTNIGVGYFIKEYTLNPLWAITVKVFDVAGANRDSLLKERIPADMKVYSMLSLSEPEPKTLGNREWFVVKDATGAFVNFYTAQNNRYYQVNITADVPILNEAWIPLFFDSFEFLP